MSVHTDGELVLKTRMSFRHVSRGMFISKIRLRMSRPVPRRFVPGST